MEKDSFKVLEYNRILDKLQEKAGSAMGKELCRGLLPSSDVNEVREWLAQTAEAVQVDSVAHPPIWCVPLCIVISTITYSSLRCNIGVHKLRKGHFVNKFP